MSTEMTVFYCDRRVLQFWEMVKILPILGKWLADTPQTEDGVSRAIDINKFHTWIEQLAALWDLQRHRRKIKSGAELVGF